MLTLTGLLRAPRRAVAGAVAVSGLFLGGCASAGDSAKGAGEEPPDNGTPSEELVSFIPSGTLTLSPSELARLTVEVSPKNRQEVAFELLTENQSFDGFLVEPIARARADGTASVELRAPSHASLFNVRASLSRGPEAIRSVSVSAIGYGTIRVQPVYGGVRQVQQWTASVRDDVSCNDLDPFREDGPLIATGSSAATISDVPVGLPIVVSLRGGRLVAGCATVPSLSADEIRELSVEVKDRPIDLQSGVLSVSLGVESTTNAYAAHFEQAISAALAHFRAEGSNDAQALLAWMADELNGASGESFLLASESHNLDVTIDQLYAGTSPLSDALSEILTQAANRISGNGVFRGNLTLGGESSQFLLTEAAGVPAALSGFFQGSSWMASAEAEDTVVLGGSLTYEPLRWLVAIADNSSDNSSQNDTSALARVVASARCSEVASTIHSAVEGPTHDECEEECLEQICTGAVSTLWNSLQTLGSNLTTIQLGMSGRATLSGLAQVDRITGTWLGRLTPDETSLRGPATAERLVSP
jgi:hypothetical protein